MGRSLNRWLARDRGEASYRAVSCPKELKRCFRLLSDDFCFSSFITETVLSEMNTS